MFNILENISHLNSPLAKKRLKDIFMPTALSETIFIFYDYDHI